MSTDPKIYGVAAWESDLENARDVPRQQKQSYPLVLHWYEAWRLRLGHDLGAESARIFWQVEVRKKPRERWQLQQWAEALRWLRGLYRSQCSLSQSLKPLEGEYRRK